MRPKSIGWFHSKSTQTLELVYIFQLVLITFHAVRLPQGFRLMDLVKAAW